VSDHGVQTLIWIATAVAFLLTVFGAGYHALDMKKADKATVEAMATDIRELRTFFLGPPKR